MDIFRWGNISIRFDQVKRILSVEPSTMIQSIAVDLIIYCDRYMVHTMDIGQ